jgi:hypothetical protein
MSVTFSGLVKETSWNERTSLVDYITNPLCFSKGPRGNIFSRVRPFYE